MISNTECGPSVAPIHLRPTATTNDIVDALSREGAAVIDGLVPASLFARIEAQLSPWFDKALGGEGPFLGRRTKRFSSIFDRSPLMAELAIWPEVLAAVEKILLGPADAPSADCIQIHLTQAIGIEPGEPAQALHRDDTMFPFRIGRELMINVMWTLDEFSSCNGATKMIPGSHLWDANRRGEDAEACAATASPGSAIIWLGSTWHGGGANRSNACRRGVVISYSLGWLAQAEKLLLSLPPATVRRLPARLQALIGYQVHRPNLGWIEGRDPREWLHGNLSGLAAPADHMTPEMQSRIEARLAQRSLQSA